MNLFVLVSTGQNVANLPPALELAVPGDKAVWIESPSARKGEWSGGASEVLRKHGLEVLTSVPVEDVNDPASLVRALMNFVTNTGEAEFHNVFAVANGGPKLTPIGLLLGLQRLGPVLLYGDEPKTTHTRYTGSFDAPPQLSPYTQHRLDLPDILLVTGHEIVNPDAARRIWSATGNGASEGFLTGLSEQTEREPYGTDEDFTSRLHLAHHRRALARKLSDSMTEQVPYAELADLVPEDVNKWLRRVNTVRNLDDEGWADHPELGSLYHTSLKLAQNARTEVCGLGPQPEDELGKPLERAVAKRVRDWLATPHPAVQSVWTGVQVASTRKRNLPPQEYDVLFVLKNGIILHLDCKAAGVKPRDLDTRLLRLQRTGSLKARLAIVVPVYTRHASEAWFRTLHDATVRAEKNDIPMLRFTWPGQPDRYDAPGSNPPEEAVCPAFETALDDLLRPYRPL